MPRRRISVLPAYSWDAAVNNYVDIASGKFVARSEVLGLLDNVSESIGSTIGDLAAAAQRGDLTARQFYEGARRTLKHGYNADVAMGMGGWDRVTPAEWGRNGGHLNRQYEYLRNFAGEIERGEVTEAQAAARGRLYADGAHKRYWETHQEGMAAAGYTEERWLTVGDASVCATCSGLEGLGAQPMGSLPTPPDPHMGCRCRKEFRQLEGRWE